MLIKIIRFPFFIIFLFLMLLYNLITRKTFYDHIITSITEDFFALNNYDQISSRYTKQEIFFLATIDSIMRYNNGLNGNDKYEFLELAYSQKSLNEYILNVLTKIFMLEYGNRYSENELNNKKSKWKIKIDNTINKLEGHPKQPDYLFKTLLFQKTIQIISEYKNKKSFDNIFKENKQ